MKKVLVAILITIPSARVFADNISLAAGSSATVGDTVVTCASDAVLPLCSVHLTGAPYTVYVGNSPLVDEPTMDEAIAQVKKLRDGGLCQ